MVMSGWIQGAPLFNLHIKSIAIGYYGTTADFVRHTEPWTLWTIVTTAPLAVAKQYLVHVDRHFTAIGGTVFGLAGLLLARRSEGRAVAWLAFPLTALVLGLAMKFYTDRAILLAAGGVVPRRRPCPGRGRCGVIDGAHRSRRPAGRQRLRSRQCWRRDAASADCAS